MTKKDFKNKLAQEVYDIRVFGSTFSDTEILRRLYAFGFSKMEGIHAMEWINKQVAEALK